MDWYKWPHNIALHELLTTSATSDDSNETLNLEEAVHINIRGLGSHDEILTREDRVRGNWSNIKEKTSRLSKSSTNQEKVIVWMYIAVVRALSIELV
jgi:hypothetical protein